jgi:hypothetical protein
LNPCFIVYKLYAIWLSLALVVDLAGPEREGAERETTEDIYSSVPLILSFPLDFVFLGFFWVNPVGWWGLCKEENLKSALMSIGFVFWYKIRYFHV